MVIPTGAAGYRLLRVQMVGTGTDMRHAACLLNIDIEEKLAASEEAAVLNGKSRCIDGGCCDCRGIFAALTSQVAGQPRPRPRAGASEGQTGALAGRTCVCAAAPSCGWHPQPGLGW
eukprot:scaffold7572_cov124-Isochrysis_galbana.AAC.3